MDTAPIALFVYNRPWHARQTVEALQKNELAEESDVFIFSDAPKTSEAAPAVQEVREYIRCIGGFKSVCIVEREENMGLAHSIIDGVTKVCGEYGRVIVLEDDLVTSPYFLRFMNRALDVYEGEERVMHVSGYMFPVKNPEELPETFLYRVPTCWGWATWNNAWGTFESNSVNLLDAIDSPKLKYEFDVQGAARYIEMLKSQIAGANSSWAVRWYASIFLHNGLCLHTARSLTNNIGHDGTGVHCASNKAYEVDVLSTRPVTINKGLEIKEDLDGLAAIKRFTRSLRQPLYIRVYSRLTRGIQKLVGMGG